MLLPLPPLPVEEERCSQSVRSPPPARVLREPGKRRARRKAQLDYILSSHREDDDDDMIPLYQEPRDDIKRMIQSEEFLRTFLSGKIPVTKKNHTSRRRRRGPPLRIQEAQARWLSIERALRVWFRHYALRDPALITQIEDTITDWIYNENQFNNEPLAFALGDAPDHRLIYVLARFHGCRAGLDVANNLILLARPSNNRQEEEATHRSISIFEIIPPSH